MYWLYTAQSQLTSELTRVLTVNSQSVCLISDLTHVYIPFWQFCSSSDTRIFRVPNLKSKHLVNGLTHIKILLPETYYLKYSDSHTQTSKQPSKHTIFTCNTSLKFHNLLLFIFLSDLICLLSLFITSVNIGFCLLLYLWGVFYCTIVIMYCCIHLLLYATISFISFLLLLLHVYLIL